MMRLGPLALGLLLLAGVVAVDGLDDVGLDVYAENRTQGSAVVHVVVSREGRLVLDEGSRVEPGGYERVGTLAGQPGGYAWSVSFGRDSAHGTGDWTSAAGPMTVTLLPDGEIEVGLAVD